MADEIIGGVAIGVTADFSALDAAFDAAVQKAVADGQSLADAISSAMKTPDVSGVTGAVDQIDEKWQQLGRDMAAALGITLPAPDVSAVTAALGQVEQAAQQTGQSAASALQPIGGAAQAAGDAVAGFGQAAQTAGEEVAGAGGQINSMVESLSGLLVLSQINSQLEAIGSAIAEATDSFTRANIALTTITGDAAQAQQTLAGLSQLGQSDGLSMPALQQAAVRLQQMLPAGTDVVGVLGNIADGAAVMGTSIDAAATKFFTLVDSGNASIKALAQLGLNFQSLADGINKVNPALGATADNAKELFKSLDDQGRIAALQGALSNLAGTAQQVAQQTFGGLWASLIAQWDQLLESAGEALLPLAKALKDFASADVIPALQAIVDAFKALPSPLQDAVLAIGGLAAAIVPLGVALGGGALAVQAIGSAMAPLAGVVASIGEAVGAADISIGALGAGLGELAGPIGLVAVALSLIDFAPLEKDFSDFVSQMTSGTSNIQTSLDTLKGGLSDFATDTKDSFGDARDAAKDFMNALAALDLDVFETSLKGVADAVNALIGPLTDAKVGAVDLESALMTFTLPGELKAASSILQSLSTDIRYAKDSFDLLTGDITNSSSATSAAADALNRLDDANRKITESAANAALSIKGMSDSATTYSDKLQDLLAKQVSLVGNVGDLQVALDQAKAAYDAGQISAGQLAYVQGQLDTATKSLYGTVVQMPDAFINYKTALDNTSDDMKVFIQAENDLLAAHQKMIKDIAATGMSLDQYWADVRDQAEKAAEDYKNLLPPMALAVQALVDPLHSASDAAKQAKADFQSLFTIDPAPLNALGQAFKTLGVNTQEAKPDLDQLNGVLQTVLDKIDDTGWDNPKVLQALADIDKAATQVGKTSLVGMADELGIVVAKLQDAGAPVDIIDGKMQQWEGTIQKIAKNDLPDAIAQQQAFIDALDRSQAPLGQILQAQGQLDQMVIKWGEDTGTYSGDAVLNLEKVRIEQDSLKISADGYSTAIASGIQDALKGFDQLGQAMGQAIINGNNLGDALVGAFKRIAASILGDLIQGALNPLKKGLEDLLSGLLPNLDKGFNFATDQAKALADEMSSVGATIVNVGGDATAASTAVGGLGTASTTTAGAMTTMSASAAAAATALYGLITAIAAVIGAIAAVVGDVYLAAMDTKLFHIETSLLAIQNDTANRRADAWSQFGQTYDRLGEVLDRLNHIMDSTAAIAASFSGISAGGNQQVNSDIHDMSGYLATLIDIERGIVGHFDTIDRDFNAGLQNIASILGSIYSILTRIAADTNSSQKLSQSMSESLGTMSGHIVDGAKSISDSVERFNGAVTGRPGINSDRISNDLANAIGVANSQLAAAKSAQDELDALGREYAAAQKAMNDALAIGDVNLAAQFQSQMQAIGRQIASFQEQQNQLGITQTGIQDDQLQRLNDEYSILQQQLTAAQLTQAADVKAGANSDKIAGDNALISDIQLHMQSVQKEIQQDTQSSADSLQAVKNSTSISAQDSGTLINVVSTGTGNIVSAVNASATTIAQAIAGQAKNNTGASGGGAPTTQTYVPPSSSRNVNSTGGATPYYPSAAGEPGGTGVVGAGGVVPKVASNSPANYVPPTGQKPQGIPLGTYPDGKGGYTGIPQTNTNPIITAPPTQTAPQVPTEPAPTVSSPIAGTGAGATSSGSGPSPRTPTGPGVGVPTTPDQMQQFADTIATSTGDAVYQAIYGSSNSGSDKVSSAGEAIATPSTARQLPAADEMERVPYGYQGPANTQLGPPAPPPVDPAKTAQDAAVATGKALADSMKTLYDEIQTATKNNATVQAQEFQIQYDALKTQLLAMTPGYGPTTYNGLVPNTDQSGGSGGTGGTGPAAKGPPSKDPSQLPLSAYWDGLTQAIVDSGASADKHAGKQEDLTQKIINDSSLYFAASLSGNQQFLNVEGQQLSTDVKSLQVQTAAANAAAQSAALTASLAWLDQQQGLSASDKAIATATYKSDAAGGSLPTRPGNSGGFSGYNPYGTPSFDVGGIVPEDMIAMIHRGEAVLPPDLTAMLRRAASQPAMDSSVQRAGANIVINAPITVNGVQDGQTLAKTFVRHLKLVVPQGGLTS